MDRIVFYHPIAPKLFPGEAHPDRFWPLVGAGLDLTPEQSLQLGRGFWGVPVWNEETFEYIATHRVVYKQGVQKKASESLNPSIGCVPDSRSSPARWCLLTTGK